jgi:anti-anti-sigma factor
MEPQRKTLGRRAMQAIAPRSEWDVQRGPDWLLVRLRDVDVAPDESPTLAQRLWRLLEQHFTYRLVLEMDEVRLLNSYLVGQLIQLYRWIEEHDGVLRLCGLSPSNQQVLHTCRLDDRLLPYGDRQEAVMGCPHPRQPR